MVSQQHIGIQLTSLGAEAPPRFYHFLFFLLFLLLLLLLPLLLFFFSFYVYIPAMDVACIFSDLEGISSASDDLLGQVSFLSSRFFSFSVSVSLFLGRWCCLCTHSGESDIFRSQSSTSSSGASSWVEFISEGYCCGTRRQTKKGKKKKKIHKIEHNKNRSKEARRVSFGASLFPFSLAFFFLDFIAGLI